ncbi:MAG: polysaccharide deacetylase family protein [Clostridia bacterium]|nr:polysaccharide deacetylase family protein [Clostridia bacterium]
MRYQFLRYPEGKDKAVTLSYDDGCHQDIRFADTISAYGLKCTFNLNSDELKGEKALSTETVKTHFLDQGHEIAIHGYFHRAEGALRPIEGIQDVLNCRLELERKYGTIIRGMAYPDSGITRFHNGADYDSIKAYLTHLDIAYCRTLGGDNTDFMLPTDWHRWMPTAHHTNSLLMEWIDKFLSLELSSLYKASQYPRLFYLWGHAYEFDHNDNWELLDQIGEKLGGKDDIWYATNMEIYEYVTAYELLIYSADGTRIYNPTLFTLLFERDQKLYTIQPGETLEVTK